MTPMCHFFIFIWEILMLGPLLFTNGGVPETVGLCNYLEFSLQCNPEDYSP